MTSNRHGSRRYVARHDLSFPVHEWIAVVEDADLRSPHADVWETISSAQAGTTMQTAAARGIVALIADHIVSVQTRLAPTAAEEQPP